jgi:hypothetical protein
VRVGVGGGLPSLRCGGGGGCRHERLRRWRWSALAGVVGRTGYWLHIVVAEAGLASGRGWSVAVAGRGWPAVVASHGWSVAVAGRGWPAVVASHGWSTNGWVVVVAGCGRRWPGCGRSWLVVPS